MLRVLASGVDRLELSARGPVRAEVLSALERAKLEAQRVGESEPLTLAGWERMFLVQGHGRRAYPYVLQGANYGLTVRPRWGAWEPKIRRQFGIPHLSPAGAAGTAVTGPGRLRPCARRRRGPTIPDDAGLETVPAE